MLTKAQIKHFQGLKLKRSRQNYAEFIVEGHKLVTEALLEKADVQLIMATKDWIGMHHHSLFHGTLIEEVNEQDLAKVSSLSTPPPVMAVIKSHPVLINSLVFEGQWSLVLDGISDPGNFGTIIRSADWFGVKNIICSEDCVEVYNPKVLQSTMGSVFRSHVVYTDLKQFLKNTPLKKFAATLGGENIHMVEWPAEGIIVTGNESHGIRKEVLELCDHQITIPGLGRAESLNAAVATSIILSKVMSLG